MTADDAKKPESLEERVSYSYGLMIAKQLNERGIDLDFDQFATAFKTVLEEGEPLLSDDEVSDTLDTYSKILAEKSATGVDRETLDAGKKFLEENLKKDGIKSTASGLQYEVIKEGDGAQPAATDVVEVHYHGTLLDGTVFDSSVDRGETTSFPLNRVIPGWTEGLQLMKEGGKYRFFIPYDLAYGERGAGADIKPYSTLIFEVELFKVGE
ncbi:MAG: FKBP-type peptidyl-prolyl cis-trans isomerase [Verrucomicrobiota bacterium]|nr:FKBP-type peptidyl-prolyl cis-trans isomerase [Verrucomicrobiota bacterium]